uniref:Uncharacterized protein n=1 Tax=Alexandrium monilatum TaxID=311494 RepID=A0A7S4RFT9_9DINO
MTAAAHGHRATGGGRRYGGGAEGVSLDWSSSCLTDADLEERVGAELPTLLRRLRPDEGRSACTVNLAGNKLSGRQPLGTLLRQFREAEVRVTCLRLHRNHLRDEAVGALIEHIKASAEGGHRLTELHLSDNHLTEVGVRDLIEAAFRGYNGRRGRALWLRAENQHPPIANPRGVLDSLAADGMSVRLLPSKEYLVPGVGRPEVAVHLHHAFVEKTDQRWNAGLWVKGKGSLTEGASCSSHSPRWGAEKSPTKDRGQKWSDDRGYRNHRSAPAEQGPPLHAGKGGYDRVPKGRAAEQLRPPNGRVPEGSWRDWPRERSAASSGDWGSQVHGAWEEFPQGYAIPQVAWEQHGCASQQWLGNQCPEVFAGAGAGLQPAPMAWQQVPNPSASSRQGGLWLARAAESVRCKISVCQNLGILESSLNPAAVNDAEWMRIARLGAHNLAKQCSQRASVVIGSFMEEDGLQEATQVCAGEAGLAATFRELRLSCLLQSGPLHDEKDDNQCATLVAAIFGELLDVPPQGESDAHWNARKMAEWALLDAVFLLGSTRLVSAGAGLPRVWFAPHALGGAGC